MGREGQAQESGTVLVIDDDTDTSELIKRSLEKSTSFKVFTASSGHDGLVIFDRQRIDVVILDYVMPEMDGSECFQSIKQRDQHVPVIFLTGFPESQREKVQLSQGAFDFMIKPISPRDLSMLVTDAYRTSLVIQNLLKNRA